MTYPFPSLIAWRYIERPGQFLLRFDDVGGGGAVVESIEGFFDGHSVHEEVLTPIKEGEVYLLNRHAQVVKESKIVLKVGLRAENGGASEVEVSIKRAL